MVFAREDGSILDHPGLHLAGVGGGDPRAVDPDELVPLPRGSDLFALPGRAPVGIESESRRPVVWDGDGEPVRAVAAFLAPAWTLYRHAAYRTGADAPALPLYAYAAVGWADGCFWTPAVRVDQDVRQDPWRFDLRRLERQVERRLAEMPGNLVATSLRRCALEYHCRAAQNFFIGRHEAPLPTSIGCNSRCVGCISLQSDGTFPASHERIRRAPTPDEIADVAVGHIERVPEGVVSFGQGCEGEPLIGTDLLPAAIRAIRARTARGTVNLNSNGSLPDVVRAMCEAGLDSMRVSINSPREAVYDAYYRPQHYRLDDVVESLRVVRRAGGFRAINYLVFPGVTDTDEELDGLLRFIDETDLDMIQTRNLNIDPEVYRQILPPGTVREGMGMATFMRRVRERVPHIRYGYFNPSRETYASFRAARA